MAKRTTEEYYEEICKKFPTLEIQKFVNAKEKQIVTCKVCGYKFETSPETLFYTKDLTRERCDECRKRKFFEEKIKEFNEKNSNDYEIIDSHNIRAVGEKVDVLCKKCGNIFSMRFTHLYYNGQRCPACNQIKKTERIIAVNPKPMKTTEEFKREVAQQRDGNIYEVVGEYRGIQNKVRFRNKITGAEFETLPCNFFKGCREGLISRGEKDIVAYLLKENIEYETQKKFPDLYKIDKTGRKKYFRFDFYIPKEDLLLEYDGEYHFIPSRHSTGKESFMKQQDRDVIKMKYVKEKNIKLLRIPFYLNENLFSILDDLFKNSLSVKEINEKYNILPFYSQIIQRL